MPTPDEQLPPEGVTVLITGPFGDGQGYYLNGVWWRSLDGDDEPNVVVWTWQPLGDA